MTEKTLTKKTAFGDGAYFVAEAQRTLQLSLVKKIESTLFGDCSY